MTATSKKTCDVFLSHALSDRSVAAQVTESLKAAGLQVFHVGSIEPGIDISNAIWEALAESRALVAIVSPNTLTHDMGLVEIGAATAWNKPIFLLLNGPSSMKLPTALAKYPVYPLTRLDDVIQSIKSSFEPLSESDRDVLADLYQWICVPADRLSQSPKALNTLVRRFNRKIQRRLSGERVLSELMRMRKQGQLPRLSNSTVKRSSLLKRNRVQAPKVRPSPLLKQHRIGTRKAESE